MSRARTADEDVPAGELAAVLRDARFVRVVARADGDALAASGILARALRDAGTPFQVRVTPDLTPDPTADDGVTVLVGDGAAGDDVTDAGAADAAIGGGATPASVAAFDAARELGGDPDPVLGLAGVVAAGSVPGGDGSDAVLDAAADADAVTRRPGVAVPTADLGDGLAHSTLFHAPFSGDVEATTALLADLALPESLDDDAHRRVASVAAVETAAAEGATPRAAASVERALRPYATPDAPFETVGGYADVLDAVARERSGTGVALALGHDARIPALGAWRDHALAAHTLLRDATTGRYDGLFVARVDSEGADAGRLATAARLLRDFRSPEPVALVVTEGAAAAASVEDRSLGRVARDAVAELDGEGRPESAGADADANAVDGEESDDGDADDAPAGYGDARRGEARFRAEVSRFITAFRGQL